MREVIIATHPAWKGRDRAFICSSASFRWDQGHRLRAGCGRGDIEYAAKNTLLRALAGRQSME